MQVAQRLVDQLEAAGVEVLLDDRSARPGPKFKDADLIGLPLRVTVGKRSLKDGLVELRRRDSGQVTKLAPDQTAVQVAQLVQQALA